MADLNFTTKELESEEWRPIKGIDGAEVSNLGRVRSRRYKRRLIPKLRIVKGTTNKRNGYRYVNLTNIPQTIHRLVLEAFAGPCPDGMEACHSDGIRANNRLSNLRWDTTKANHQDSVRHGTHRPEGLELGRQPKLFKYTPEQIRWILANRGTCSQRELSHRSGVHYSTVRRICQGRYNPSTLD